MKKSLLALAALVLWTSSAAARATDVPTLRDYARRALAKCPDTIITLEEIAQRGPANFDVYELDLRSSDKDCNTRKFLLFSPVTQQVLIGSVIPINPGPEPLAARLSQQTSSMMKAQLRATIAPFPLPDGLRSVALTKNTAQGPFSYHGYLDSSGQFLIIGTRGNLAVQPAKTLRDALGIERGVRRGNAKSKVEIIELSDLQCPTCGNAHKALEPLLSKNLSKMNYIRIDLPLFEHHEWSLNGALAAHAVQKVAPSKYWSFIDYVFKNQETIGKVPFDKIFRDWVEDNDVPWTRVEKIYHSAAEKQSIIEGVSRAFDNGVNATPTFLINGQIIAYGSNPPGKYVEDQIRAALK